MFDVNEAKKTGVFISGINSSGKSNWAYTIIDTVIQNGFIVHVFDNSQAWRKSNIPIRYLIQREDIRYTEKIAGLCHYKNIIYDVSLLYQNDQEEFLTNIMGEELKLSIENRPDTTHVLVIEEAQTFLPQGSVRSNAKKEVMRAITLGRNYNLRFMAISPIVALIDKNIIRMCGQKYLGYSDELNEKIVLKNWIGVLANDLDNLKTGEFFYKYRNFTQKIVTPLHIKSVEQETVQSFNNNGKYVVCL